MSRGFSSAVPWLLECGALSSVVPCIPAHAPSSLQWVDQHEHGVGGCQLTRKISDRGAIYEDTIPKKFSKMALIEQGQWTTAASVRRRPVPNP